MMDRRILLLAPFFAALTSSCATENFNREPEYSLADVLETLPSIRTGADFIARFGAPNYVENFPLAIRDDRRELVENPPGLLDRLEYRPKILKYIFRYGVFEDEPPGVLLVCVDKNDLILGWLIDRFLVGKEREAMAQIR